MIKFESYYYNIYIYSAISKASLVDVTRVNFDVLLKGGSNRSEVCRRLLLIPAVASLNLFKLERSLRRSTAYSFDY